MGIIFVILIFSLWAWYIVLKAYKFMRDVVEHNKRAIAPRPSLSSTTMIREPIEADPYSEGAITYRMPPGVSQI